MKKNLLIGAALAAICLIGGLAWWLTPGKKEIQIEIPNGARASETADILKEKGVIRSAFLFKVFAKLSGVDRSLKPGRYLLHKPLSSLQAVLRLHKGRIQPIRVVIPEGFMAKQIADRLEAQEITASDGFMEYVRLNNLEGFLFPTTYHFDKGLTPESVAHHMHVEFQKYIKPIFDEANQQRFTLKQALTLASIVQREARAVDEMPKIAAVYSNRLKRRMRLEADPTVQYAMGQHTGKWYKGLRHKHLENPSDYNTYRYFGLPPGPICNPGVDAVRAALHPEPSEDLYFVAKESGYHIFSKTFDEHKIAIARIKREKQTKKSR